MLVGLRSVKVSWATWGRSRHRQARQGASLLTAFKVPHRRVLLFYPFAKKERIIKKMKKQIQSIIAITLAFLFLICAASCGKTTNADTLWENAIHKENAEFGSGAKTLAVEVKAGEKSIIFTIHTDKDTVGAALSEHGLIAGEEGPYGLYVKAVNGITADYDVDQSYWGFYINGELALTGVDKTNIEEGVNYQLAYTK